MDITADIPELTPETPSSEFKWQLCDCCCCFSALCSGGDKHGKTACKQPADSQPNQSAVAGTSESTAQRKEAVRCLAAKVAWNTHMHTHTLVCCPTLVRTLDYSTAILETVTFLWRVDQKIKMSNKTGAQVRTLVVFINISFTANTLTLPFQLCSSHMCSSFCSSSYNTALMDFKVRCGELFLTKEYFWER